MRYNTVMFVLADISLSFNNSWLWFALLGLVVYLGLVILLYRKTNPPFSRAVRLGLGIARYLALIFVILCVAEPVLSMQWEKKDDPLVVFLADNSSSINTVENFEAKRNFLNSFTAGEFRNLLPDDTRSDVYLFSDTLRSADNPEFDGQQTAIGDVINYLRERYRDENLTSIVIASDGLSNFGIDPVMAARQSGVPIYTVDLGPQKISRDIRIVDINHDPVAYSDKPFEIEIEIEGRGFERMNMPMVTSLGEQELDRKNIEVLGAGQRQRYTVEITPREPGVKNFNVRLPVQPEEELSENNSRNFSLKVLQSRKRILVVTDELNWDVTFLNRAISESPDYETALYVTEGRGRLDISRFPNNQDSLNSYDIVIFLRTSGRFVAEHMPLLNSYVRSHGGSVWFIPGLSSMERLAQSEDENILPYVPHYDDRYFNDFNFHATLTEDGRLHPVTRLRENARENSELWQSIPPFEEHVIYREIKPEAKILAVHPEKEINGRVIPVIFYHTFEAGKVLTFAAGPIWKIDFVSAGYGDETAAFKKLIMNSISWLTTREDVDRIRLATDKNIYRSGERVQMEATVLDQNYSPLENAVVDVVVRSADSDDSLIVSMNQGSSGQFNADLGLLQSGDYTFTGTVVWEDKVLEEISGDFKVEGFSLEQETLFLPPDMMQKISQASGGRHYNIDNFNNLRDDVKADARLTMQTSETRLASNLWMLIIILGLLSIEWLIRKRLQLL